MTAASCPRRPPERSGLADGKRRKARQEWPDEIVCQIPHPRRHAADEDVCPKVDADRFLVDVESSKQRGAFVDARRASLTVGVWADDWLAAQADLSPTTRNRYQGIISKHIRPRWGRCTAGQGDACRGAALAHPARSRAGQRPEGAPCDVKVLAYAVRMTGWRSTPRRGEPAPRTEGEKRFLTHQQVRELADACGDEYRLVVLFLAYTGLRWGEMAALTRRSRRLPAPSGAGR